MDRNLGRISQVPMYLLGDSAIAQHCHNVMVEAVKAWGTDNVRRAEVMTSQALSLISHYPEVTYRGQKWICLCKNNDCRLQDCRPASKKIGLECGKLDSVIVME